MQTLTPTLRAGATIDLSISLVEDSTGITFFPRPSTFTDANVSVEELEGEHSRSMHVTEGFPVGAAGALSDLYCIPIGPIDKNVRFSSLTRVIPMSQNRICSGNSVVTEGEPEQPLGLIQQAPPANILDMVWQRVFPARVEPPGENMTWWAVTKPGSVASWIGARMTTMISYIPYSSAILPPSWQPVHQPPSTNSSAFTFPHEDEASLGVWSIDGDGIEQRIWAGMSLSQALARSTSERRFVIDERQAGGEHIE